MSNLQRSAISLRRTQFVNMQISAIKASIATHERELNALLSELWRIRHKLTGTGYYQIRGQPDLFTDEIRRLLSDQDHLNVRIRAEEHYCNWASKEWKDHALEEEETQEAELEAMERLESMRDSQKTGAEDDMESVKSAQTI